MSLSALKKLSTYIASVSLFIPLSVFAQTPQVQTTSAYIQLISVLDGTQNDIEIPGMPSPALSVLNFVAKNKPEIASAWINEGADFEIASPINCTDVPEDFLMEDHDDSWSYRDIRTLGCSWGGQVFSIKIEVLVEENDQKTSWISTDIQSVE
jgi:hypothetical protein